MRKNRNKTLYLSLILQLLISCTGNKVKPEQIHKSGEEYNQSLITSIDILNSSQLDAFPAFESIRQSKDTLYLLGNDDFVFYPFGKHKEPNDVVCLAEFESHKFNSDSGVELISYDQGTTHLALILTDPGEYIFDGNFAIVYASITDDKVSFERNIHAGISYSDFVNSLGIKDYYSNIRVVQWDTCLEGGRLLFSFDNDDCLSSIEYVSDFVMLTEIKDYYMKKHDLAK